MAGQVILGLFSTQLHLVQILTRENISLKTPSILVSHKNNAMKKITKKTITNFDKVKVAKEKLEAIKGGIYGQAPKWPNTNPN